MACFWKQTWRKKRVNWQNTCHQYQKDLNLNYTKKHKSWSMQSLLKGFMLVLRDSKLWLVSLFLDCWYGKILWFVSWWICTSRIGNSFPYAFNNCHSRNLKAHSRGGANMLVYLNCQEMTSCSFGFALMLWILHGYYSHLASLDDVNGFVC